MCGGTLSSSVLRGEVERMVERMGRGDSVVISEDGKRRVKRSRIRRDSVRLSSLIKETTINSVYVEFSSSC